MFERKRSELCFKGMAEFKALNYCQKRIRYPVVTFQAETAVFVKEKVQRWLLLTFERRQKHFELLILLMDKIYKLHTMSLAQPLLGSTLLQNLNLLETLLLLVTLRLRLYLREMSVLVLEHQALTAPPQTQHQACTGNSGFLCNTGNRKIHLVIFMINRKALVEDEVMVMASTESEAVESIGILITIIDILFPLIEIIACHGIIQMKGVLPLLFIPKVMREVLDLQHPLILRPMKVVRKAHDVLILPLVLYHLAICLARDTSQGR
jgi:hypothetical protein